MDFPRRLFRSAGFRFALLYTGAFLASVLVLGFLVETAVRKALWEQARGRVDSEVGALVDEFVHGGRIDLEAALVGRFTRIGGHQDYALIERDGRVAMGDHKLATLRNTAPSSAAAMPGIDGGARDRPIIAASRTLGDGTTLIVADDLQNVADIVLILHHTFALALITACILGLGLGVFVSSRLLRRVDAVTRTAEAIIAGDLGRRIEVTGSQDDFDRLARTLNRMLDRIAGLLENLRQVSNDIAHDMRTPLTRLRQGLQAAIGIEAAGGNTRGSMERAIAEIDTILEIFSALLRIAQIEGGARRAGFRSIDLSDLLRVVGEDYAPAVEDSGRHLTMRIEPGLMIEGDRELLVQAFANLIENAVQHTPTASTIEIGLRHTGDEADASFADTGPGIPEAERAKVLQRFYRMEKSRGTPGHGLGLTLVAAIASHHRSSMRLTDNAPGLRVSMSFALSGAAAIAPIGPKPV